MFLKAGSFNLYSAVYRPSLESAALPRVGLPRGSDLQLLATSGHGRVCNTITFPNLYSAFSHHQAAPINCRTKGDIGSRKINCFSLTLHIYYTILFWYCQYIFRYLLVNFFGTGARIRTSITCFGDKCPAVERHRYKYFQWFIVAPKSIKQPLYDIGCRLVCSAIALGKLLRTHTKLNRTNRSLGVVSALATSASFVPTILVIYMGFMNSIVFTMLRK